MAREIRDPYEWTRQQVFAPFSPFAIVELGLTGKTSRKSMRFLRAAVLLTATTAFGALATPARAQVSGIDLSTMGITAPTIDVGTTAVQAGTVQYSNSGGSSDAFSVGTSTSISASASASSTPDYSVNSTANFGVDQLDQPDHRNIRFHQQHSL